MRVSITLRLPKDDEMSAVIEAYRKAVSDLKFFLNFNSDLQAEITENALEKNETASGN